MTAHHMRAHHMTSHCITWHDTTQKEHITSNDMTTTSHHITWHVATNHITSPHITSQPTTLLHLTPQPTSWHQNRSHHHHGTSPQWNGWTLVCTKNSVWASDWFVSLRAFYKQILSCSVVLFLLKFPPPARPGTTWRNIYIYSTGH